MTSFGITNPLKFAKKFEAADGQTALQWLSTRSVDIIITDLCMEPLDGIEFTRRLRHADSGLNAYTPVLVVSGHTEASRVKNAVDAGVNGFLAKPVTPRSLRLKLAAILASSPPPVQTITYCGPDRRRAIKRTINRRRASDKLIVDI